MTKKIYSKKVRGHIKVKSGYNPRMNKGSALIRKYNHFWRSKYESILELDSYYVYFTSDDLDDLLKDLLLKKKLGDLF